MQLTDKQKGITLAFFGVLMITPDSLFIRLVNINSDIQGYGKLFVS